jgi:ABC-type sugar transport system substrate-binding protein
MFNSPRKLFRLLAILFTFSLVVAACGSDDKPVTTAAPADETISVCFMTLLASHPYVTPFNETVTAAAAAAGVELTTLSSEADLVSSTDQLNQCVAQDPDAIMLWPVGPSGYLPGLIRAQNAGIPVITVDSGLDDGEAAFSISFVSYDLTSQGADAADLLLEELGPDGGDVVVIEGIAGNSGSQARIDGFNNQNAANGGQLNVLASVNGDFDQQVATVVSRDLITRFGTDIQGVFAADDSMAKGWADAAEQANFAVVPLVGVGGFRDAFDLINEDRMLSTIIQSPVSEAQASWDTTMKVIMGEAVESWVVLPRAVLDKSNIGGYVPVL